MISLFTIAAAGAAAMMSQGPSTTDPDPLIGAPVERFSQPADLHAEVRSERRDPDWAPRMEDAVRARLLQIPLVGKDSNELRVTCGSTLCELAGTLIGSSSSSLREYDPDLPLNRAVADLQDKPLNDDLARLGLKRESGSFTGGKGKPDRSVFLLYYSRAK